MAAETGRTDRGHVIIRETADETYQIDICESVAAGGEAINTFARHSGVPRRMVRVLAPMLATTEGVQYSADLLEVFVDSETNDICVATIQNAAFPSP